MKTRTSVVISALKVILLAASASMAQKSVGSYRKIANTDAGAAGAASFAVDAKAEKTNTTIDLVSDLHAESQMAAGTNYKLCLKVITSGESNEADATITAKVVVSRNLKGVYSLTSWVEEDCEVEDG